MIHYRFHSSTAWHDIDVHGPMTAADCARHILTRHGLQRVVLESDTDVLRPDTWVVVRHVPKHWAARTASTVPATPGDRAAPADTPDAFGPDPMDARPIRCARIGARLVIV